MKALASQGLLGLIIPKEFGGMDQNHVCMAMVVETIARYGCPSTAMVCGEYHQCQLSYISIPPLQIVHWIYMKGVSQKNLKIVDSFVTSVVKPL